MSRLVVVNIAARGDPETRNRNSGQQRHHHDLQVGRTIGGVDGMIHCKPPRRLERLFIGYRFTPALFPLRFVGSPKWFRALRKPGLPSRLWTTARPRRRVQGGPAWEENSNKINGRFEWAPGGQSAGLMSARTSLVAQNNNRIMPSEVVACGLERQMAHGVRLEVAYGRVVDADGKPADNLASRLQVQDHRRRRRPTKDRPRRGKWAGKAGAKKEVR